MSIELIAEVSTNHGGSVPLAKDFIARFADAGATWIKFQYTRVRHLRPDDPQYAWFQRSELSLEQFAELKAYTEQCGAKFLITVYHATDVPEVVGLGVEAIKLGAGEWAQADLVEAVGATGLRMIRSWPVGVNRRATVPGELLATACRYPAPRWLCKAAIRTLGRYGVVGYSDHAIGLEMCQRAIDAGATILEKHVQLPTQARPSKPYEATVEDFKGLRAYANEGYQRYVGRWRHHV